MTSRAKWAQARRELHAIKMARAQKVLDRQVNKSKKELAILKKD